MMTLHPGSNSTTTVPTTTYWAFRIWRKLDYANPEKEETRKSVLRVLKKVADLSNQNLQRNTDGFWRKKFTTMRLCYGLVVLKYLLINLLWHIRLIVKKIILSMSDRHELTFHKALNTINCFCGYFGLNHHCTRKIKGSITEAVVPRCSIKKVFLEILQNSEENTCARVPFLIKLQASGLQIY